MFASDITSLKRLPLLPVRNFPYYDKQLHRIQQFLEWH